MGNVGDDTSAATFGELNSGFDFGKHGAGFEITVFFEMVGFGDGEVSKFLLVRQSVIDIDIRDSSNGNENVGFGEFGEFLGGVIFVNDSVDAF